MAASMIQYHTEQTENVRANGVATPLPTVDAANRYGLTCANLPEWCGKKITTMEELGRAVAW